MKRILITTFLVLMVIMLTIGTVLAKTNKININGEVKAISGGTLVVESNKVEFVIMIPDGFELGDIKVGDSVLVKAKAGVDDTWVLETIKQVELGSVDDKDDNEDVGDEEVNIEKEETEGFKENSAFCANGKQEKSHPLAPKLAERLNVTEEWVIDRFCEGYSIGAIMLAIKTSQMNGITATPDQLLAERETGIGWGLIWKGLNLIGSEKEGDSPPGILKKPVHAEP